MASRLDQCCPISFANHTDLHKQKPVISSPLPFLKTFYTRRHTENRDTDWLASGTKTEGEPLAQVPGEGYLHNDI